MHAHEVPACEMHVYKVHVLEIHACEVHAHEIYTHEMMPIRYTPERFWAVVDLSGSELRNRISAAARSAFRVEMVPKPKLKHHNGCVSRHLTFDRQY
jgi:hypothetical protein